MTYQVDSILDSWFGGSPLNSDDAQNRLQKLYEPLRKLEDELKRLRQKDSDSSWERNPDCSGGQFTLDEIYRYDSWT
jgi:hypothetical protein